MRTRLVHMTIVGLILTGLLMACSPYVQTVVPEREKPTLFRLSPNRRQMLYRADGEYYVLNLDTNQKTSLLEVHKMNWWEVEWAEDRYLYSRGLVVDTEIWEVQPLAAFSPAEQARIEAGRERWRHEGGGFQDQTPYYSPDGRYYFRGSSYDASQEPGRTVVIYTAAGQELLRYEHFRIDDAQWAADSSGVYLLLNGAGPLSMFPSPGPIVKLLVPRGK